MRKKSNTILILIELVVFLVVLTLAPAAFSADPSITKTEVQGREVYVLQNDLMRMNLFSGGGYIGDVSLLSPDPKKSINPMRVPHYPTIEPQDYDPAIHDRIYGDSGDSKIMAGYMGHFLCFPYFGGYTSCEKQLGYQAHGEAAITKWNIDDIEESASEVVIRSSVDLPVTSYAVRRDITLRSGQAVALVEEEVENLVPCDRPFQWVQHLTFGDPFVATGKNFADAPVSGVAFSDEEGDQAGSGAVQWPTVQTPRGGSIDASAFSVGKGEGSYRSWLIDPGQEYTWITTYNQDYNVLIGYVLPRKYNSWIADVQENGEKEHIPWDSKTVFRGLIVGTSPFVPGIKASVERGPILNTRTYAWIGAKETLKQSYLIFLYEIDSNFKGVASLNVEDGAIVLVEKETGTTHRLENDFSLRNQ